MEKEEFMKKAAAAGFTEEDIAESLRMREKSEREGYPIPYEMLLANFERPLVY